jgi:ribosomal protein S18 acetylase RimI-like enzyme
LVIDGLVVRALTRDDFDAVHTAFVEAFSDYVVKLSPTRDQLAEMTTRRGYVPEASVGVFEGSRMVAFTLNGIDGTAAYDTGTGVVPSHRRRGLGRDMLSFLEPRLRERGCTRYVLEVLEANHPARALYRNSGFDETRGLQCWTLAAPSAEPAGAEEFRELALEDVHTRASWCDIEPSWQNTLHSIERARDSFVVIGNEHGHAVLFPSNGDVPQLAVRPDARCRGIGSALLREVHARAAKPLRIMNVDDRDRHVAAFLERAGAQHMVRQIEMVKAL